jgi:hypothetical protein
VRILNYSPFPAVKAGSVLLGLIMQRRLVKVLRDRGEFMNIHTRARAVLGNIFGTVSRKQMNQKELKITARCAHGDAFEKQKHNHPSVINPF